MSSQSMPSKPIHFFDVPEIKSFSTKYSYNFFVSDESINETGNDALNGNLSSRFLRKGTADTSNMNSRIPRYVEFTIEMADSKKSMFTGKRKLDKKFNLTKKEILGHLNNGSVLTEDQAAELRLNSFCVDNTTLDVDLENLMRTTLNMYTVEEASITEAAKEFSSTTKVNSDFIFKKMIPPSLNDRPQGLKFKEFNGPEKKVKQVAQLNYSFAPQLLRKSVERGTSISSKKLIDNYLSAVSNIKEITDFDVTSAENVFNFDVIDQEKATSNRFVGDAAVVGIIVEKKRVFQGVRYPMPAIVITGERPTSAFDSQVAYGQTYEYVARTIAKFVIPVTTEEGRTYIISFLVASKPSPKSVIKIEENRAPSYPKDVNYYYEYDSKSLWITWSPPTNPQRDVKYYQVFRRTSTDKPFELIAHLDFDDSVIRNASKERIDPTLMTSFSSMPLMYIDSDFNKSSTYIYAVVSVDARQISSGYSTQIKVSFDSTKNKIKKEFVCYGGAPKQYPNWTLKENFFVDSMKDSNHDKVNIYFNPEAYTLIRGNGEVIPTFYSKTDDSLAKYVFQFINTDRLLEQKFEVAIDDSNFKKDINTNQLSIGKDDDE